ncbi:hypothetical protein BZG36_01109 [Bifiguratus adelaidae]|uniref:Serine aminopeptidase S33 domain-containing protein n=1 Tax=Bifiguratus adelaidae TaxID=1938954 RepID=A0A261Y615_9FUNG|nr:hypothetical protein BZG36_01109 [Bifiguratus adelaidae]
MDSQINSTSDVDLKAGHPPAQMAGGRRMKQPNHVPLKVNKDEESEEQSSEGSDNQVDLTPEAKELARRQASLEQKARDKQTHFAKHTNVAASQNDPYFQKNHPQARSLAVTASIARPRHDRLSGSILNRLPASNHNAQSYRPLSTGATIAAIVAGLPIALYTYKCLALVAFQNKLIYLSYIPLGARQETLDDYKTELHGLLVTEAECTTQDRKRLRGIVVQRNDLASLDKTGPEAVLIYFQGNAGNMYHRLPVFRQILKFSPKMAIVAIGYRGYGNSTGRASERGLRKDAESIWHYAQSRFPGAPIFVMGHSLGGAVASYLLHALATIPDNQVRGLILENTFLSIQDMVEALYGRYTPYPYIARVALWNRWQTKDVIQHISLPILFLSSTSDEIVPANHMRELYQQSKSQNKIWVDLRAMHMDMWEKDGVKASKTVGDFIHHYAKNI